MYIRKYRSGEELQLYEIFYSAVHENTGGCYTEAQLNAWAPLYPDTESWKLRIQHINPFVADGGELLGYADIQSSGYIDHFFVRGKQNRKGIGQMLMDTILQSAQRNGISEISADVSLSAQQFFIRNGFEIVQRKTVSLRGEKLENILMIRRCRNRERG